MGPIDFDELSDAPYRLPSRHPAAGRGMRRPRDADDDLPAQAPPTPAATSASNAASELKRRQESLLLSYIIYPPGRY
jgi:hypothetical protein